MCRVRAAVRVQLAPSSRLKRRHECVEKLTMHLKLATLIQILIVLAFAGLGLKLFWAAHRQKSHAEWMVGSFFLGIALELACYATKLAAHDLIKGIAVTLSSVALMAFVRKVFRPKDAWAQVLFWTLALTIGAVFIVAPLLSETTLAIRLAWSALRGCALFWAFAECTAYYRRMNRRVVLGLAEPVVANRFLLWSLWTGGTAMLPLSGLVLRILTWAGLVTDYTQSREATLGAFVFAAILFSSLVVAAAGLWLSFFPPKFYKTWIERRASAASSPA